MTNYVQSNTQKKGLTIKDLITIGVFTAIIYVCDLLGGTVFAITPTLTFYFPSGVFFICCLEEPLFFSFFSGQGPA